ncbi:MAG: tetratricopeptide repeat protein [Thermoguttaceae bacterium]
MPRRPKTSRDRPSPPASQTASRSRPRHAGRGTPPPRDRRRDARAGRLFGRRDWVFAAALAAAVFLAYQPAWNGGFIWDDESHVTAPPLRSLDGLRRIWFEAGATQQYYPLLHSVFWVEQKLWGDAPLGYHLVNILLHTLAALMAAILLRRLEVPGAYLAAAIFALHPVHVESVAWIAELKNTLSAVFHLAAAIVYLRFDRARSMLPYMVALLLFVLGLLSKTVTATLPAALLVVFWWQRGRLAWKRDVLPLAPFFLLGGAAGLFTAWVERTLIGAEGAAFDLSLPDRFLIAGRVVWFYAGKLFWPAPLVFIYPRWNVSAAVWWQYLFPAAALAALAVLWSIRRRRRGPLAGVLFFIGTLFPVLGFCNVFPFLFSFVADHFQYLASLGLIALASAGIAIALAQRRLWDRPAGYAVCLALLAVLAVLTWRQSGMYVDAETVYRTTIERNPRCAMALNNLGALLYERLGLDETEKLDEPEKLIQRAMELDPRYGASGHDGLGRIWLRRLRADQAMFHFNESLRIDQRYVEAYLDRGLLWVGSGQFDYAIADYQNALEIAPRSPRALGRMAWLRAIAPDARFRNGAEAVRLAELAVQISGGTDLEALDALAAAYAETGRFPEAVQAAQKALGLATARRKPVTARALRERITLYQAGSPYHLPPCK